MGEENLRRRSDGHVAIKAFMDIPGVDKEIAVAVKDLTCNLLHIVNHHAEAWNMTVDEFINNCKALVEEEIADNE